MRSLNLKTRISLSLLLAFLLVAGVVSVFARASFVDLETSHAEREVQARTDAVAEIVDTRFTTLGQAAVRAAGDVASEDVSYVLDEMARAGFDTTLILGSGDSVLSSDGEVASNASLRALLLVAAPAPGHSSIRYSAHNGWLIVGARSPTQAFAVVGAISEASLSAGFLYDAFVHPEYGYALVTNDGEVIASSANFGDTSSAAIDTTSERTPFGLDARVEGRAPGSAIEARADAMSVRFLLAMAVAFGIAGSITILLVAVSFRPLDKITDAARRLGRGDEDLELHLHLRDELGELANVLNRSAATIAAARRAQLAAAEDFELAVGDLSRAVGEADTPPDVAARLSEAILRVTSAEAVVVRHGETILSRAGLDISADAALSEIVGVWTRCRARAGELEVSLLAPEGRTLAPGEIRKVDLLSAQAAVAIHRAQAAVDLRTAKAQKETFLDILSHDLKNPLAVARGRVELLSRKEPHLGEKLRPVEASLDRATRIIEEAVLLSKLERGDALERSEIDLASLVEESVASLRPLATPRGIALRVESADQALWPANPLLARAVENLVSNAIKWSPQNGSVEIRIVPDDHVCLLMVVDHGPGIPNEDKKRLFARFERADRTGVKGTGLGLAIALRVTQMHGGDIRIEDTPGGGATFVLQLPIHTTVPAPTPQGVRA